MPGTDVAFTCIVLRDVQYWSALCPYALATRCPVLTWAMLLPGIQGPCTRCAPPPLAAARNQSHKAVCLVQRVLSGGETCLISQASRTSMCGS
eukprot:88304-Rhodomonas_salina.1